LSEKFDDKLNQFDKEVDGKLDEMNQKMDERDKEHTDRFSKIQASLDGLKWFLSGVAAIASGVSIAHSLGWIFCRAGLGDVFARPGRRCYKHAGRTSTEQSAASLVAYGGSP